MYFCRLMIVGADWVLDCALPVFLHQTITLILEIYDRHHSTVAGQSTVSSSVTMHSSKATSSSTTTIESSQVRYPQLIDKAEAFHWLEFGHETALCTSDSKSEEFTKGKPRREVPGRGTGALQLLFWQAARTTRGH
jgi:hypothetical protein